jgi:hypothetical protein
MTIEQAREILKTVPKTSMEVLIYKQALAFVSNYYLKGV